MDQFRVKGNDLADYLHIDNSLISKWKTGKRKLSSESETLNTIVDFFIKLDSNTDFLNILSLLRTAYPGVSMNGSDKMKILLKRWLTEDEAENYFLSKQIKNINVKMTQNILYKGDDGRQRAAMDLVDLMLESTDKEEIMIMDYDRSTWKYKDIDFHMRWFQKYEQIIEKGHKVVILDFEDRSFEDRLQQLTDWLGFYIRGNVEKYINYGEFKGIFKPSLLVLKDKAALFGITAEGFTSKMNVQITSDKVMIDHCTQLYEAAKSLCSPIFHPIKQGDLEQLLKIHLSMEREAGDMILKDTVPYCMLLPEELFYNILKENLVEEDRIETLLDYYNEYSETFFKNIHHFKYRVLLDEFYLENAMISQKELEYSFLSILTGKPIFVSKEYCCYHLDHMMNLMNTYKNFEMSFGSYQDKDHFKGIDIYLKKYKMTIASGWSKSIYSREPSMNDTLYMYYTSLWDGMSSFDKDRTIVEQKIRKLSGFHSYDV
ncbi:hypothetical protein [Alkalibaculum sporogenes]|nr:hypothetical protein [Alkalibaculum sporogenes]